MTPEDIFVLVIEIWKLKVFKYYFKIGHKWDFSEFKASRVVCGFTAHKCCTGAPLLFACFISEIAGTHLKDWIVSLHFKIFTFWWIDWTSTGKEKEETEMNVTLDFHSFSEGAQTSLLRTREYVESHWFPSRGGSYRIRSLLTGGSFIPSPFTPNPWLHEKEQWEEVWYDKILTRYGGLAFGTSKHLEFLIVVKNMFHSGLNCH